MNVSPHISASLAFHLGSFQGKLCSGELLYPEDVAIALDDLALMAWRETRELYPNSILLEGEVVDNTSSVSQ